MLDEKTGIAKPMGFGKLVRRHTPNRTNKLMEALYGYCGDKILVKPGRVNVT
jgi:hypothetical protein